jgi:hypothetical protein
MKNPYNLEPNKIIDRIIIIRLRIFYIGNGILRKVYVGWKYDKIFKKWKG